MEGSDIVVTLVILGTALACIATGRAWRHGKLLRFIAGNAAAYDKDLDTPEQRLLGKQAGNLMISAGVFCLLMSIWHLAEVFNCGIISFIALFLAVVTALIATIYAIRSMAKQRIKS